MMLKISYIWEESGPGVWAGLCRQERGRLKHPLCPPPDTGLTWPSVHWHLSLYAMKTRKEFTPAGEARGDWTLSRWRSDARGPPLLPISSRRSLVLTNASAPPRNARAVSAAEILVRRG